MSKFTYFLKRLVFTQAYCDFYPLKGNGQLCEALNSCEINDGSKEANLLDKIISVVSTALQDNSFDQNIKEKEIKTCHKKRKMKKEDENGHKYKVKVDVVRFGFKKDEENYQEDLKALTSEEEKLKRLGQHIQNRIIDLEDMEHIDKIIYNRRLNIGFEIFVALVVIVLISALIIKKYAF